MVKEIIKQGTTYFQCEECKFFYETRTLAQKCEDWCKKTNSCNLEIIKQAIKLK